MAKKYLDPKDIYNIVKKYLSGADTISIYNKHKNKYSWSTVYRFATGKYITTTNAYLRQVAIESKTFEEFIEKTWNYFPFPEYWPADKLCAVIQYSAKHEYKKIISRFGLEFKEAMLRKIFENGAIKKAATTKCYNKQTSKTVEIKKPKISVAEINDNVANKQLTVAELIEQLKQLTGAKEIIIKV